MVVSRVADPVYADSYNYVARLGRDIKQVSGSLSFTVCLSPSSFEPRDCLTEISLASPTICELSVHVAYRGRNAV